MQHLVTSYKEKLTTPEKAVQLIPSNGVISIGMRAATPPALLTALAERARAKEIEDLKVYYMRCGRVAVQTIFQEDLLHCIRPISSMLSIEELKLSNRGFKEGKKHIHYLPASFSAYPRIISEAVDLDAFLVTVAPMDSAGYFNFGINGDYAIELSRKAKKLIVEVNENMPRVAGQTLLHVSEVDAIIEHHIPLEEDNPRDGDELDEKIGSMIAEHVPDGATIQMGIGGVPNAVCKSLKNHKDLGIHTEVITQGLVDLIEGGVITNRKKQIRPYHSVFTFAAGNRALYQFLHENLSMLCLPVSYVNDPYIIGQNDNMVSVNSFIEIDFSGQVNAEFIGHQYSGPGGQLDFLRGAYLSKGGKSILASHSTNRDGTVSKIVPRLSSVTTDTRLDIDYVATEYGICQLRGKTTTERTLALIQLAHPKFRDELMRHAKEHHFV